MGHYRPLFHYFGPFPDDWIRLVGPVVSEVTALPTEP